MGGNIDAHQFDSRNAKHGRASEGKAIGGSDKCGDLGDGPVDVDVKVADFVEGSHPPSASDVLVVDVLDIMEMFSLRQIDIRKGVDPDWDVGGGKVPGDVDIDHGGQASAPRKGRLDELQRWVAEVGKRGGKGELVKWGTPISVVSLVE